MSLFVQSGSNTSTGVALANPNTSAASVTLTLRDANSNVLATTSISVPPNGHIAKYANEIFGSVPAGEFHGKMDVVSTLPVAAMTLRQRASVFTSLPVIPWNENASRPVIDKTNLKKPRSEGKLSHSSNESRQYGPHPDGYIGGLSSHGRKTVEPERWNPDRSPEVGLWSTITTSAIPTSGSLKALLRVADYTFMWISRLETISKHYGVIQDRPRTGR
jgi:hypothetical protein